MGGGLGFWPQAPPRKSQGEQGAEQWTWHKVCIFEDVTTARGALWDLFEDPKTAWMTGKSGVQGATGKLQAFDRRWRRRGHSSLWTDTS